VNTVKGEGMIHVITSANRHLYEPELLAHFRLRHEIYVVERNWTNLSRPDGLERDQFDNEDAIYILASEDDQIIGGSRLVPTTRQVKLVRYIRDMSREMAKMANTASFDFLFYLLYLVVAEAQSLSNSELTGDSEDSLQN